jgi:KaiC/GvpD/RAD55 family RecA-like ATPase
MINYNADTHYNIRKVMTSNDEAVWVREGNTDCFIPYEPYIILDLIDRDILVKMFNQKYIPNPYNDIIHAAMADKPIIVDDVHLDFYKNMILMFDAYESYKLTKFSNILNKTSGRIWNCVIIRPYMAWEYLKSDEFEKELYVLDGIIRLNSDIDNRNMAMSIAVEKGYSFMTDRIPL